MAIFDRFGAFSTVLSFNKKMKKKNRIFDRFGNFLPVLVVLSILASSIADRLGMEPFWLLAYKAPYKVQPLVSSVRLGLSVDCPNDFELSTGTACLACAL